MEKIKLMGNQTSVCASLTLGTKKRSALNLKSQSSKKWKRSDSISSPETKQRLGNHLGFFYYEERERERNKKSIEKQSTH